MNNFRFLSFQLNRCPPSSSLPKIHFYGDSLGKFWSADLPTSKFSPQVFCKPGATASNLKEAIPSIVDATVAQVIVHVGTNNLKNTVAHRFLKDFERLLIILKDRYPCAQILVSSILPRFDNDNLADAAWETNFLLSTFCRKYDFVDFINIYHEFLDDQLFGWDGLHLTRAGYKLFAHLLSEAVIRRLVPHVSLPPTRPWQIPPLIKKEKKRRRKRNFSTSAQSSSATPSTQPNYIHVTSNAAPRRSKTVTAAESSSYTMYATFSCPLLRAQPSFYRQVNQSERSCSSTSSSVPLPRPPTQYIQRKRKGRKKKKMKQQHRKRRRRRNRRKYEVSDKFKLY